MIESDKHIIKTIELLSDFLGILSDGYNPTVIWLKIDRTVRIKPEKIFNDHWFGKGSLEQILSTKKELNKDLEEILTDCFEWSLVHLRTFNKSADLFNSKYHCENLNKLIGKVKNDILNYFDSDQLKLSVYIIDTKDGSLEKYLFLESNDLNAYFVFGNYIH
ncbi:hypothetical protein [Flammeovirga sp. SJP92]|uniref:hypothetical protein n=1 Tax=Flammeovirga sp. SJP92 TaxID=1775430 RepID=UPI0007892B63|nr:hypothetical protein [Flammeovirga sp. SJP92]KXX66701.1 hypothetical protein AVL50_31155 [Flammeovirga sp. SJP92]